MAEETNGKRYLHETLSGPLQSGDRFPNVNSDCTATLTVIIYESGVLVRTSVLSAGFVDDSNKVRMVQEPLTLPDGTTIPVVITASGNKLFREEGD